MYCFAQSYESELYPYPGVPFPKNFMSVAKTILKRLFRVYAHIYHQHFDAVMQLQEEAHLNTSFKHFIFFVQVLSLLYTSYEYPKMKKEAVHSQNHSLKWLTTMAATANDKK